VRDVVAAYQYAKRIWDETHSLLEFEKAMQSAKTLAAAIREQGVKEALKSLENLLIWGVTGDSSGFEKQMENQLKMPHFRGYTLIGIVLTLDQRKLDAIVRDDGSGKNGVMPLMVLHAPQELLGPLVDWMSDRPVTPNETPTPTSSPAAGGSGGSKDGGVLELEFGPIGPSSSPTQASSSTTPSPAAAKATETATPTPSGAVVLLGEVDNECEDANGNRVTCPTNSEMPACGDVTSNCASSNEEDIDADMDGIPDVVESTVCAIDGCPEEPAVDPVDSNYNGVPDVVEGGCETDGCADPDAIAVPGSLVSPTSCFGDIDQPLCGPELVCVRVSDPMAPVTQTGGSQALGDEPAYSGPLPSEDCEEGEGSDVSAEKDREEECGERNTDVRTPQPTPLGRTPADTRCDAARTG
jgi:hypothetical protein